MQHLIELDEISYIYEEAYALKNVSFTADKGEAIALMGPNGCGKSTLIKLINGIIFAKSGTYCFEGEPIDKKKLQDNRFAKIFHKKIGFVFQNSEFQLFCSNVLEEIAFGPRQMGMDEKQTEQRAAECLSLLGIESLAYRAPYHLSEGEKKKVALACVLAYNPDVLTLDEPLNGLDPKTQRWLVDFLIQLNRAGKTLITSTHNIELVHEIANRVVLFDESHTIRADMKAVDLLKDIDLLKEVNLVDPFYRSAIRED